MVDARTILLIVITALTAVFIWSRRTYLYWQRRRIKFVQPTHLFGNLKRVLREESSLAEQLNSFYFNRSFIEEPLIGIYLFHQPALLLRDLNLIRIVLVEDFVSFSNRFARCDNRRDKLGSLNLYFAKQPEWQEIRTKMTPTCTSAKLRQMFSLMLEIGGDLERYLGWLTESGDCGSNDGPVVNIKEICDLYNTDMIASIAFGFRSNSLRNRQTELGVHTRRLFASSYRRALDLCLIFFLPRLSSLLRTKLFSAAHAQFLRSTIRRVIAERRQSGLLRNDLVEMLLTLQMEATLNSDRTHFTHQCDYLAAQAATFELAGIENCSSALSFALFELARAPALQERLRAELRSLGAAGAPFSFEAVAGLQYLAMVVDETLRKYPIVAFLERECTPINRKRFYSFRPKVDCYVRRGMPVFVSVLAIHHDPKYWPQPQRFDPERFGPQQRTASRHLAYLPFGAGPRNCIGQHIALLQLKLGLAHLLRGHRVAVCDRTVDSIAFDAKFALLSSPEPIYLKLIPLADAADAADAADTNADARGSPSSPSSDNDDDDDHDDDDDDD